MSELTELNQLTKMEVRRLANIFEDRIYIQLDSPKLERYKGLIKKYPTHFTTFYLRTEDVAWVTLPDEFFSHFKEHGIRVTKDFRQYRRSILKKAIGLEKKRRVVDVHRERKWDAAKKKKAKKTSNRPKPSAHRHSY